MIKELLFSQQLEIRRIIESKGLSYADFKWYKAPHYVESGVSIPALIHGKTGYHFELHFKNSWGIVKYFPGDGIASEVSKAIETWAQAKDVFSGWLHVVTSELEAKRLLDEPPTDGWIDEHFGFAGENSEEHFSPSEREHIGNVLKIIEERLLSLSDLSEEEISTIKESVDDLSNATIRLNKKDWKGKLKGFLYDVAVGLGQETIITIFNMAAQKLIGN